MVMLIPVEMVMENAAVAVFERESVTVMLKLGLPTVVGLPPSTPAAERVNPPGSVEPLVTDQA